MPRSVVLLLPLLLAANACAMHRGALPEPDPELVTAGRLNGARMQVVRYSRVRGHPPTRFAEVCAPDVFPYCTPEWGDSARDGWGTRLAYARDGEEVELRSGGADRVMHTPDDLVVRPSAERERVRALVGCYAIPAPRHGRWPARQVWLDSTTDARGEQYRARMSPGARALWSPLGDVVLFELFAHRYVVPFVLRPQGDDLAGREGSPWTADPAGDPVVLRRIPCTSDLTAPWRETGSTGTEVVADTDRELWPDPRDRTEVRMEILRGFLRDHLQRRGRLPERLRDAVPADPRPFTVDADGWGNPFRYARVRSSYVLGSAGPDGKADTEDDIVVTLTRGTKWGDDVPAEPRPEKRRPGS